MVSSRTISERLAEFVAGFEYERIPSEIIERLKWTILDQLGCELIGSTLEWNKIPYRFIRDLGGRPESSVVNFGTKTLVQDAAYVNGVFGQGAELDDYIEQVGSHPSTYSVPTALALAEKDHLNGKQFIAAVSIGYEVSYRIAKLMYPGLFRKGFHSQGTIGAFAVAALAGKLLRLNQEELVQAFGVAGSHASGTMEYDQSGGEVKRLHTALGVRAGIQSAMLASYGMTGPRTIFEGKRGIAPLYADQCNVEEFETGSQDWGIKYNVFKIHSCCGTSHTSIDALGQLIVEGHFEPGQIEKIEVHVGDYCLAHGALIVDPHDVIGAQFSLPFSLAIRLLKGSNDLEYYMEPRLWRDPQVVALVRRVEIIRSLEFSKDLSGKKLASRVVVRLKDGKVLEAQEEHPKGSPANPLTKEELQEKFRRLTRTALPVPQVEGIIDLVDKLEQVTDMNEVVSLMVRKY